MPARGGGGRGFEKGCKLRRITGFIQKGEGGAIFESGAGPFNGERGVYSRLYGVLLQEVLRERREHEEDNLLPEGWRSMGRLPGTAGGKYNSLDKENKSPEKGGFIDLGRKRLV